MFKDIVEIEQLLYRCCHAVDRGELEKIMDLFHPQAILQITWEENGLYAGHDAIRAWFKSYISIMQSTLRFLRHNIASPMIEVTGEVAAARSYMTVEAAHNESERRVITLGRYNDKLRKLDGRWFFMEKVVSMDDVFQH